MANKHTEEELLEQIEPMEQSEKNVKGKRPKTRGAEIVSIFAAHNFYANGFSPVELRTTLEDLGPTYVKIGQIMSSRPDLLPERYCKELEKLRQTVKPLDPAVARQVIEQETGKKIDEIFSEFRDEPLGSASIGQAHYAVLKDGTKVVIKVQRPLIADMMMKDYALLKKLAKFVNVVADNDGDQAIDLVSVLDEMEKVSREELDFRVEANNTKFFKENCIEDEEKITCPTVIDELSTERIFAMTFVDGYSVSKKQRIIDDGYDPVAIGRVIVENFAHQILDVGVFHADPHQGNIMVSAGKPNWIDFGMIGRISEKDINNIQSMILALLSGDVETLVGGIISMGATSSKTNRDKLVEDATVMLEKYSNATGISDVNMSGVFDDLTEISSKHHISLPGQFTMLGRSVLAIEGVIEQLCPELNLLEIVTNKMMDRAKKNLDFKQKVLEAGKDLLATGKKVSKIPMLAADSLEKFAKGKSKINMSFTDLDEPMEKVGVYVRYVVLAFMSCILFIGSCILAGLNIEPKISNGMPLIAIAGILFSVALAIYSVRKLTEKHKK